MSFVLHIFDEPSVMTVQQATDYCYADHPPFPTPNNRYTQFLAEVTRMHPEDSPVWPENFLEGEVTDRVYNLGVNTECVTEQIMNEIALCVAAAGLQMLDPQNAMLYRRDGTIVGPSMRTRLISGFALQTLPALLPAWDKHEFPAHTILHQQFSTRMAHHGFAQTSSRGDIGFSSRVVGETRQTVIFQVQRNASGRLLNAHVEIAVPRVSFVWKSRFPRDTIAYLGHMLSLCEIDFRLELPELSARSAVLVAHPNAATQVHSRAEFDQWIDGFCDWYEREAGAVLDRIANLRELGKLLFTDDRLELARHQPRSAQSHMSLLVLARALEVRNFDAWVNAVWTQVTTDPSDYRERLRVLQETLKTLIAYLRSPAFELSVESPKWRWSPSPRH